jgi:hypothetical protein
VKKTNKELVRKKKKSRFRNNKISVLVVLVLFLQHLVLVLVFKHYLCLNLARWLGDWPVSFSCLSGEAS